MMQQQFTSNPINPLFLACQVMKRALEYYHAAATPHGIGLHGLRGNSVAREAIRKAEVVAGVKFAIGMPWLDEWIGLGESGADGGGA